MVQAMLRLGDGAAAQTQFGGGFSGTRMLDLQAEGWNGGFGEPAFDGRLRPVANLLAQALLPVRADRRLAYPCCYPVNSGDNTFM